MHFISTWVEAIKLSLLTVHLLSVKNVVRERETKRRVRDRPTWSPVSGLMMDRFVLRSVLCQHMAFKTWPLPISTLKLIHSTLQRWVISLSAVVYHYSFRTSENTSASWKKVPFFIKQQKNSKCTAHLKCSLSLPTDFKWKNYSSDSFHWRGCYAVPHQYSFRQ